MAEGVAGLPNHGPRGSGTAGIVNPEHPRRRRARRVSWKPPGLPDSGREALTPFRYLKRRKAHVPAPAPRPQASLDPLITLDDEVAVETLRGGCACVKTARLGHLHLRPSMTVIPQPSSTLTRHPTANAHLRPCPKTATLARGPTVDSGLRPKEEQAMWFSDAGQPGCTIGRRVTARREGPTNLRITVAGGVEEAA